MYNYKTVKTENSDEFVEKKSRFIGYCKPVTTEDEAIDFVRKIRAKHPDATHNVYAYKVRENNIQRYSDDGEPSGTAGIPTLDVILKEDITDVCVVVTRYFGGTLLGGGGLVRAYSKSAKIAIDAAQILKRSYCFSYTVNIDYSMLSKVQSEAAAMGCISRETVFANDVTLTYYVPYALEGFEEKLVDVTNGRAIIKKCDNGKYVDVNP